MSTLGDQWEADTSLRRRGCLIADLATAVTAIVDTYPDARLVRNRVGNLSVMVDGVDVGYLDLTTGRWENQ